MPTFTYHQNIPDAPNNPSVDQPKMKTNTNSINSIINVDHSTFNNANGGYHKDIHVLARTGNPTPAASTPRNGILFTKEVVPATNPVGSTDVQLFYQTAGGGVTQLTGSNSSAQGYQWIGEMLIQWGFVSQAPITSGSVTFKSATSLEFPNNCRNVQYSLVSNGGAVGVNIMMISSVSKTGFSYNSATSNNSTIGFYWFAVGN